MAAWPIMSGSSSSDSIERMIVSGFYPLPNGKLAERPSNTRSCEDVLELIELTVHQTLNELNYNGLRPHLQIVKQLEEGKTFKTIQIDSQNELLATTCAGMSHALLKNLEERHGITGYFALQKRSQAPYYLHATVIIECSDGYILLDSTPFPDARIRSLPFKSQKYVSNKIFEAREKGATTPLKITTFAAEITSVTYETRITNADDMVMKTYALHSFLDDFIPIVLNRPDGSTAKFIGIIPGYFTKSGVLLKDKTVEEGPLRTQLIAFDAIRKGELRNKLRDFLQPTKEDPPLQFQLSLNEIHEQIERFAAWKEPLRQLFKHTGIDERL